tara:strand:- start:11704 stop:12705 length:1002 start_codon:yes stop_codon:yes gene_type:complete
MKIKLHNKRILVTGGAGFIGSSLCEKLISLQNEVICLDNFSTGKMKNIKSFINNKKFTLIEGDIRDIDVCISSSKNVDYILHQAALGSVPRSIKDPISTNDININGFLNVLSSARINSVKRFVYAASSSTYGDSKILPKSEHIIGKPLSVYAVTKYVNELYADLFSSTYGLETIGLRYFNVYGKRQDPNGPYAAVIPKFINLLLNGQSPTINGDGSFTRDFTYIDDVVDANLLCLTTKNKSSINTVYNIAYGASNSLNDLAKYLKKYISKYRDNINEIEIKYGPSRVGDVPHSLANIQKAKKKLGYNPNFSLEEGLKEVINWYMKNSTKKKII